jgi:hypothetical protein
MARYSKTFAHIRRQKAADYRARMQARKQCVVVGVTTRGTTANLHAGGLVLVFAPFHSRYSSCTTAFSGVPMARR